MFYKFYYWTHCPVPWPKRYYIELTYDYFTDRHIYGAPKIMLMNDFGELFEAET